MLQSLMTKINLLMPPQMRRLVADNYFLLTTICVRLLFVAYLYGIHTPEIKMQNQRELGN